ncbi:trichohyalin [Procambarus clarkii]|uniref:trichohyalin n=1 Tax=Procambarus clarkii TaxID=6728 RepID=UPI00374314D2
MTSGYWNKINEKLYGSEGNLNQRHVTWKPPKYGSQQQLSSSGDSLNRTSSAGRSPAWGTSKQILSKKRLSGSVGNINVPEGSGSSGGQSSQGRSFTSTGELNGSLNAQGRSYTSTGDLRGSLNAQGRSYASTGDLSGSLSSERQHQEQQHHYSTSVLLSRQISHEDDIRVGGEDVHSIQRAEHFASSEQERVHERREEQQATQRDDLQISHLRQDEYARHTSKTEELHGSHHLSSFSRYNSQERLDFATGNTRLAEQQQHSSDHFVQEQSRASSEQTRHFQTRSTDSHSDQRDQQVVHTARPAYVMLADSPDHSPVSDSRHNFHPGTQGGSGGEKPVLHRARIVSVTDDEDDDEEEDDEENDEALSVFTQEQEKSLVTTLEKEDQKEDLEGDQDHEGERDHEGGQDHEGDQDYEGNQGREDNTVLTLRKEVKRITKLKEEIEENFIKTQAELKREVRELTERRQKEELRWKQEKTTRDVIIVDQKGRIEALTEERDKLQGQLSEGKQEASGHERVKELEERLQQEQQRHHEQLTKKEREVTSLKAELKERDRDLIKSQSQALAQEKLKKMQDHLHQEQDLHQAQLEKKERDISSLRSQLQERDSELSRRQDQVKIKEKLEQQVRQLEDQVGQLEDEVRQLKDQVRQLEDEVRQLEDEVKQLEDQVRRLDHQARQLRQEQQRHQEQLAKKDREISTQKTRLQEREEELTRLQAQAPAPPLQAPQLARVKKQIEELQEELRQEQRYLREQLAKKEREVFSLRTELQERNRELARRQSQVTPSVPPLQTVSALGLPNLGNTSYMNSVVQCLFNINTLRQYFIQDHYKRDVKRSSAQGGQVALALAGVFGAMESGSGVYDAMRHFKMVVEGEDKVFKLHHQPKAYDLLASLLTWLHNDLVQASSSQQSSSSVISRTFHGIKESVIFCPEKKRIASIANESFDNLTLTVLGDEERPLQELLKSHLRPQEIDWECQHCRRRHKCLHYASLNKLPQVLALHFSRHPSSMARVNFPAGNLTLDAIVDGRAQYSVTYELVSVCVQQQGSEGSSGHYTAFCRSREGSSKWWLWDDTHLHPARLDNVISTRHPHLLFYEAVND